MEWYFWLMISAAPVIFLPFLVYGCKKWKESQVSVVAPPEPIALKYQGQGQADDDGAEAFWSRKDRKVGEERQPSKQQSHPLSADDLPPPQPYGLDTQLPSASVAGAAGLHQAHLSQQQSPVSQRLPSVQSMQTSAHAARPPPPRSMRLPMSQQLAPVSMRPTPSQQLSPQSQMYSPQAGQISPHSMRLPPLSMRSPTASQQLPQLSMRPPPASQQLPPLSMRPPPASQQFPPQQASQMQSPASQNLSINQWDAAQEGAHAFYGSDAFQYDANLD